MNMPQREEKVKKEAVKKPTSKPFCAMLRAGTQAGHNPPTMGWASGCWMILGTAFTMREEKLKSFQCDIGKKMCGILICMQNGQR